MPTARSDPIVGRLTEQSLVESWLDSVPNGARAMVLSGEPGIGKSVLWQHAVGAWRSSGGVLLIARPAMAELALELSSIIDLFESVDVDVDVDVLTLRAELDPIERGRVVLEALRRCARRAPTLLAIDDLQWMDAASVRTLRYALRRLHAQPIGVLATTRDGADVLDLPSLLPPGRTQTVMIGPVDSDAIRGIVGAVVEAISPRSLRRIEEVSAGNPLFALELARHRNWATGGRLPATLDSAVRHRLVEVPTELMALLQEVSAVALTSVDELRRHQYSSDVDKLLAAGSERELLSVSEEGDVRFLHPVVGSVVYQQMPTLARRSLHARLAKAASDPDHVAYHLARCTDQPDATVADLLDRASDRAADRGAHGLAAELAEHALRLTPTDDEVDRRRRALAAVRLLAVAGDIGPAFDASERLIEQLPPGPGRVEALVQRAQLEEVDIEAGEAVLVRALEETGGDALSRGLVLDQLGWLRGVFRGDLLAGIECAREAWALAAVADPGFRMSAAAGLSNMETLAGSPRPELMDEAIAIEQEHGRPPLWAGPSVLRAEQFLWSGDLAAARRLLEVAVAHAEQRGHQRWLPYSLYDLAAVEGAAGNISRAGELLNRAFEVARDCEDAHVQSWIFYRQALVATWLGRVDEARASARRRADEATGRGERPGLARARSVLGLLALSEGDTATAVTELTASVRLLNEMGFAHPGVIPALPDAIEALARHGDLDGADEMLKHLGQQAARVGSAWVDAALDRATGAVGVARNNPTASTVLQGAAATFTELGFAPDAARATLLQGRALTRSGKRSAAADALTTARDAFASMGARLWAIQADAELERVVQHRMTDRASTDLTATERRIAELVADGLQNREISQQLFIATSTVEAHLTRIYRKLQIRSRSELARHVLNSDR